mgnify:CR=1 FL=1
MNECECNNIGFINNEWLCLECGEKVEQKEDNEWTKQDTYSIKERTKVG